MIIGYTGGSFDALHIGHIHFLKECRKYCDKLVVSLNTDEFIERYKGRKLMFSFEERKTHLIDSGLVNEVVANVGDEDSKPSIEAVKPNIVIIGSDWARRDYYKQMGFTQDWLDDRGIVLAYIPYYKNISSSSIRTRAYESVARNSNS